jgi:hypothetical protein
LRPGLGGSSGPSFARKIFELILSKRRRFATVGKSVKEIDGHRGAKGGQRRLGEKPRRANPDPDHLGWRGEPADGLRIARGKSTVLRRLRAVSLMK